MTPEALDPKETAPLSSEKPMVADKPEPQTPNSPTKPKKESFLANLLMNIVLPTLILTKMSGEQHLGPTWALVVALAFPLGYGLQDFIRNKKFNAFSALGIVSVLLTGGISLLHLDAKYIAIKEAAIPALLGIATLISTKTRYPLVKVFVYNDKVLKIHKVDEALTAQNSHKKFERTLNTASLMIAGSFFISSVLNYVLAKVILQSPSGTEAFNEELGKMTALSYPVIALPMMIILMGTLFYVFRSIKQLTNLTLEELINDGSDN
jgi:hypothetical protein